MSNKMRHALAAKQNEMRLLQLEVKSIVEMEKSIKDQLNRLRIEEMGLNSSILDKNVRSAKESGNKAIPANIHLDSTLTANSTQLSFADCIISEQPPNHINQINLNLLVPTSLGKTSNISDEENSEEEEENECLLQL